MLQTLLLLDLLKFLLKDNKINVHIPIFWVELAWRSGSVMDCHAMTRGSIPGGNNAFIEFHVLRKGQ